MLTLTIETERERPRRWIAEVLELPGVMLYGRSEPDAIRKVIRLAMVVLIDKCKHGEFAVAGWKSTLAIYDDPKLYARLTRAIP